jgi:hypothetical protein
LRGGRNQIGTCPIPRFSLASAIFCFAFSVVHEFTFL